MRQLLLLTIVGVSDVPGYCEASGATPREAGELLVQHLLELVSSKTRHTPVGLKLLQLLQTPVQAVQGLGSAGVQQPITVF